MIIKGWGKNPNLCIPQTAEPEWAGLSLPGDRSKPPTVHLPIIRGDGQKLFIELTEEDALDIRERMDRALRSIAEWRAKDPE